MSDRDITTAAVLPLKAATTTLLGVQNGALARFSTDFPYDDPVAPAYLKTVSDLWNGEEVSLFRFIPVEKQAGIYAQTDNSDLTANIQDAVDAVRDSMRGALFAPAGRYNFNQITLAARLKLRGAGAQTIFRPTGVFANQVMFYALSADDLDLGNFQIDADRVVYPNLKCIFIDQGVGIAAHDIRFARSGGYAVYTNGAVASDFDRLYVQDAQVLGIYHINGVEVRTRNSMVSGVYTQHGIHHFGGNDCDVINCTTSQIEQFGINFWNMARGNILNHRSFDSKLEGINLLDSNYCNIADPQVFWTGDPTWESADFGISIFGDVSVSNFNKIRGGIVSAPAKSGVAIADDCQFNVISDVTVMNPNRLDEVQGAAVLLYGAGAMNNSVANLTAWAGNGKMRHAINEQNAGGMPTLNRFSNVNAAGNTGVLVNKGATSSYVTTPLTGTLATLDGNEALTNKSLAGTTATMTGAVSGSSLAATGVGAAGTVTANGAIAGASLAANGAGAAGTIAANGAITGASLTTTGAITAGGALVSKSPSAGVGYAVGAGGTVTQLTSKATPVTINALCGNIVTHAASLAGGALVAFTMNNSAIALGDTVIVKRVSGGTAFAYYPDTDSSAAGSCVIYLSNTSAGALAEAVTLHFTVIKSVNS